MKKFFQKNRGSTLKNRLKEKLYILIVNYLRVENRLKTNAKKFLLSIRKKQRSIYSLLVSLFYKVKVLKY